MHFVFPLNQYRGIESDILLKAFNAQFNAQFRQMFGRESGFVYNEDDERVSHVLISELTLRKLIKYIQIFVIVIAWSSGLIKTNFLKSR